MAKAVYHVPCWKALNPNSVAEGKTAKWASTCAHCGGTIPVGDPITWPRTVTQATDTASTANGHAATPAATPPATPASAPASVIFDLGALAGALIPELEKRLNLAGQVRTVEVKLPDCEAKNVGVQHKQFPSLLKALAARMNVWAAGPCGSGKTSAAAAAAKALGLPFYTTGSVAEKHEVMGFVDASGKYHESPLYRAYTQGGAFLADECDAWEPAPLLAINSILANRFGVFPNSPEPVQAHPDFVFIAAANTYGAGATQDYVGRFRQDAAAMDRFVFLPWDYDTDLELAIAPNPDWTKRVQQVRGKIRERGLKVIVSPRASLYGAQLLGAGLDMATVEQMVLKKGMTDDQWSQVSR